MKPHSESELLTVDQFAERFQVSRTTVFGWLKNGDLREGVHYIRIGRILRFRWPFFQTVQPSPQTAGEIQ
ncbi:MAG: helix-turn-helix domain-containing protein [Syntrophales bacterium LBB04]|nr:helix-turn-helix domain-containing protein [Syntrophales bacterium LBB04]